MTNKYIKINGLYKSYNGVCVIENLTISFEKGKKTVIFGPSGCGKTTLFRILAGLETPDKGEIIGIDRKNVAYVFQEPRLFNDFTAKDNIACVLSEKDRHKREEIIDYWLDFTDLFDAKDKFPHELSGGMQYRLSLARALAYLSEKSERELLLLDEAFTGLDKALKTKLMDKIKNEFKEKTIISITHSEKEAETLGDKIIKFGYKMQQIQ